MPAAVRPNARWPNSRSTRLALAETRKQRGGLRHQRRGGFTQAATAAGDAQNKPVASNETLEGRAENRPIAIVPDPKDLSEIVHL